MGKVKKNVKPLKTIKLKGSKSKISGKATAIKSSKSNGTGKKIKSSSSSVTSASASGRVKPAVEKKPKAELAGPVVKPITAELLAIRSRLTSMLSDLRKDIDHEVRGAGERDLAHINDTSDMASDSAEGDLSLRIAESETAEAGEIERAIDKIDNGTYGSCESCYKPIGVDRLQFLPYSILCIKCQELAEIRKRDDGDELDDLAEGAEHDDNA